MPTVLSFEEAIAASESVDPNTCAKKRRLLLGNGFSMGCLETFGYKALYEKVVEMGLSQHVQNVFAHFGQCNFEAVLKALDDGAWLAEHYQMQASDTDMNMQSDYEFLKNALASAISEVHPPNTGAISDDQYEHCYTFLSHFDDIYTVNYDLLLYWTSLTREPFGFEDDFNRDADTPDEYCEYMPYAGNSSKSHLYFLHGALHLYTAGGTVRKRVWERTGVQLITQIREALENKEYPLVVTEGDSESKLRHIESSSYLWNCFRKFHGIEGKLFVYGHSLSKQDSHIINSIAENFALRHLWIGLHGDIDKESNQKIIQEAELLKSRREHYIGNRKMSGKRGDLNVHFFDSASANVWGDQT